MTPPYRPRQPSRPEIPREEPPTPPSGRVVEAVEIHPVTMARPSVHHPGELLAGNFMARAAALEVEVRVLKVAMIEMRGQLDSLKREESDSKVKQMQLDVRQQALAAMHRDGKRDTRDEKKDALARRRFWRRSAIGSASAVVVALLIWAAKLVASGWLR